MNDVRDWKGDMLAMADRLLKERTGEDFDTWKRRMETEKFDNEQELRAWLTSQGVTGYGQMLLVMERFGYPDFMVASADELIEAQYADCPQLRPILDAILTAAASLGSFTIQARKTFVALVTTRRTFARIQPTTKKRVDLALRIDGVEPGGRLQQSKTQNSTPLLITLTSPDEVDDEVIDWLRKAYEGSC
jgi:hypothetical protein